MMNELFDKSPNFVQAIEYSEIESITGRTLIRAMSALDTARTSLLKTDGMVFGTITKVGIRRLADDEIVSSSITTEKRIGRMSRREIKRLSCANYSALSQNQKITHNARMTVFAMAADISSAASVRKIEGAVKDSGAAISKRLRPSYRATATHGRMGIAQGHQIRGPLRKRSTYPRVGKPIAKYRCVLGLMRERPRLARS